MSEEEEAGWKEAAKSFFGSDGSVDPRDRIIATVARWLVGIVLSLIAYLSGMLFDIAAAFRIIPYTLFGALETVTVELVLALTNVLFNLQFLFMEVVEAAGPFAFVFAAVLTTILLLAGVVVIRLLIRVIPVA